MKKMESVFDFFQSAYAIYFDNISKRYDHDWSLTVEFVWLFNK